MLSYHFLIQHPQISFQYILVVLYDWVVYQISFAWTIVGNEQTNAEIEALVQEVNNLRAQLIDSQTQISELQQTNTELSQQISN